MLSPVSSQVCVQLAFHNYQPIAKQQLSCIHPDLAEALHQVVVRRWGHVVSHLARSRFDQITNEFIGRMHAAKGSAEEVSYHLQPIHSRAVSLDPSDATDRTWC